MNKGPWQHTFYITVNSWSMIFGDLILNLKDLKYMYGTIILDYDKCEPCASNFI